MTNAPKANWSITLALAFVTGILGALEIATRVFVPIVNHNQQRIQREFTDAAELRDSSPAKSVLFVGNSLTRADLDLVAIQATLGHDVVVLRWAVDDTNYLDWLFGVRRLFEAGARPRYLLVGGNGRHFLATTVRGRYFAREMLATADVALAARRTRASATEATSMLLANVSAFYGTREEINKHILTKTIPGFPALAAHFGQRTFVAPAPGATLDTITSRITELRALSEHYGTKLILWAAPLPDGDALEVTLQLAATKAGITILTPDDAATIARDRYFDGMHLDSAGAQQFSRMLARDLLEHVR